jgi:trimethylamine:corrinoid methyltransferase-like protein
MIRFINENEMERVHEKSLSILENIGCRIHHEEVLKQLDKAGAKVDMTSQVVKFPRKLVDDCIQQVPQSYKMAAANKEKDIVFPLKENEFLTRTNTGAPHYVEHRTNKLMDIITLKQCADWQRLGDAMENVNYQASPFIGDVPLRTSGLYALKNHFENSQKHFWIQPYHENNLPFIMEMLCTIAGGKKELKDRPIAHITVGSTSPLSFKEMDTEALKLCGDYGVPVTIYSLPTMGGTAPFTVAGIVLLSNCELLAGNVVTQVCNPGTPVHFLGHKFLLDMATTIARHSAVEAMMAAAAHSEFCWRKYKIPFHTYGSGSDSFIPDEQSMIDRTFQGLLVGMGEGKVFGGVGQLETVNSISLTQLVIDNDIIGMIRKARRGVNWDDDHLAADVIEDVGIGGEYITHDHTLAHCRDAFEARTRYRGPRADWLSEGEERTIIDNANDIVDDLLKNHTVPPLSEDISKELGKIIEQAEKSIEEN